MYTKQVSPLYMVRLYFFSSYGLGLIVGAIFKYGVSERIVSTHVCDLTPAKTNSTNCTVVLPPERAILNLTVLQPKPASRFYHYALEFESKDTISSHYRVRLLRFKVYLSRWHLIQRYFSMYYSRQLYLPLVIAWNG